MRTRATARLKKGFPAYYRLMSPMQKLQWLKSPECNELLAYGRLQPNQVENAERNLSRNDRRIASIVPGPGCLDQYREGWPFPPPAETTPMRAAVHMLNPSERVHIDGESFAGELNTLWPVVTLTRNGTTYDVVADWIAATEYMMEMPPSHRPSSHALQRMQDLGLTIILGTLPPEDEHHLRQEIEHFKKTGETNERNVRLEPERIAHRRARCGAARNLV